MFRSAFAAVLMAFAAPLAAAEMPAPPPALAEAMKSFFVVLPTDTSTGNAVTTMHKEAGEGEAHAVVVAFLDAEDAAADIVKGGLGDVTAGRIVNGADLYAAAGGEVIWRTSADNAAVTGSSRDRAPAFFVTYPDGKTVAQDIDGGQKTVVYLDAEAADEARTQMMDVLAAAGTPADLGVSALAFPDLIKGIVEGQLTDVYIATSPSVIRWSAQQEAGAALLRDYQPAT